MSQMQKENSKIKTILSTLLIQCRALERRWILWRNSFYKKDPKLETSSGRHDIRRSVESFTQRVWDAVQKPKGVAELLRKQSLRTRKDEEVQRRQEEIDKRNIRLVHLSRTQGWEIDVVNMLRQWENFCYMNLRFPETRKDKVSLEYFLGYQNGSLWVIESLRKEIYNAVTNLKKQNAIFAENKNKSK